MKGVVHAACGDVGGSSGLSGCAGCVWAVRGQCNTRGTRREWLVASKAGWGVLERHLRNEKAGGIHGSMSG